MHQFQPQSIICPIMVGRDLPTQALLRLFSQAREGVGQIVLVSGEAGIGKSRLLREMQPRLPADVKILQGNCFEADQSLPFAPITDLLRAYFAVFSPANKDILLTTEMLRLLPELAAESPDVLPSVEGEQEKRQLQQALLRFFAGLAAAQPLLIIIEDIHWCDDASLEFLLLLARRISNQPVLLLLTYRDDEIGEALADFLAQLDRERLTTEFRLPPLTVETVSKMVRAIFAMERNPPSEFVDTIHSLSEGNPFFVEEMLKSLVAEGDILLTNGKWELKPLGELRIPRTLQFSLRQRLSRLTAGAHEVLSIAAVAGRSFYFVLVQRLTGIPESELLHIIRELKDAQFIVEESADTFAFRHALTQQAVYQEMFARERRALHEKIAEVMEQLYSNSSSLKAHFSDLAYHYYHAEQWVKAAQYGWEAGQYAESLYAPRAAIEHYGRAITAHDHLGFPPALSLLRARGKARETTGEFSAASNDYLRILAAARAAGDRRFEWQSLYDLGFLYTGLDFVLAGRYLHEAINVARELNDQTALAESLNRLGNWYINQDLPVDALPYHHEALTIFEGLNDRVGQAATLDLLGVTAVVAGDLVNSAAYYDQAIGLFRQLDNRMGLSSALSVTSIRGGNCMSETVYCPLTGLDFLLNYAEQARKIASAIGWQHGEAAADMYASYGLVLQGEYEQCLISARRAIEVATAASHTLYTAASMMALGRLYNDLFAFELAHESFEPALQAAREISAKFLQASIGGFLVSSHIGLGDFTKAAALVQEFHTEHLQSVGQRIVRCAEAELALVQGDSKQAVNMIDQLIETAPSSAGNVIPKLWQMKADALLDLGKPELSRILLEEAADSARRGNLKALLWRILLSQGKVELIAGHLAQAEDTFDAARGLFETLANNLSDVALKQQFMTRASALIPEKPALSSRQAARLAYDGLTEREREIAALIATGKSSREIAEALVISKRTVDAHVSNILSKLGFSSRIQIARWAVEKGLL